MGVNIQKQNSGLQSLVNDNSSRLFLFEVNNSLYGKSEYERLRFEQKLVIEVEFFKGCSDNSIEAKEQEMYMEEGLLYDILTEDQSYKMMATLKTYNEEIIGICCLVANTKYGKISNKKEYLGIYHQYVNPLFRNNGFSKLLFDSFSDVLVKYIPKSAILMQDHVSERYQYNENVKVDKFTWQDLEIEYQE